MDMNNAFFLKKEAAKPQWRVIDAEGKILGRLATELSEILRGKDKPFYTAHTISGDYIVVVNADKIVLTGNKLEDKEYARYTGYMGGYKTTTAKVMLEKCPDRVIELAVRRMLPKNKLNKQMLRRLKVYAGSTHPHTAQVKSAQVK